MQVEKVIEAMAEVGCTPKQIGHVVNQSEWRIIKYITLNDLSRSGLPNPSTYPDSYFIDRLKKEYTAQEIADELGVSVSSIYRQLSSRGISKYTYSFFQEANDESTI